MIMNISKHFHVCVRVSGLCVFVCVCAVRACVFVYACACVRVCLCL